MLLFPMNIHASSLLFSKWIQTFLEFWCLCPFKCQINTLLKCGIYSAQLRFISLWRSQRQRWVDFKQLYFKLLHTFYFEGEPGSPGDKGSISVLQVKGQNGEPGLPGDEGLPGVQGKHTN